MLATAAAPPLAPSAAPVRSPERAASPLAEPRSFPFPTNQWTLDPTLTFLNHGSYGSVPRSVQEVQADLRARMERDPVRFFKVDLERLMDHTRTRIAQLVHCRPADIAPMPNATVALCTVLMNTKLGPGDEVLITDHEYMSIVNELERVCAATGAKVVKAKIPFPIQSPDQVTQAVLAAATPRTKIAFLAHITSATSLIFPVTPIVRALMGRGIEVCVDGAHTPGQIEIDIQGLAPTYYVGSFHKWLSCPKGSGFLYVRPDKQAGFRPHALSSRAHKVRPERALFLRDFDYVGTNDYSAMLCVPAAIDALTSLLPGGLPALYRANHNLALKARDIVARALAIPSPAPDAMLGSMVTLPLPEPSAEFLARPTEYDDALQDELINRHKIVAPIWRFGPNNQRVIRVSAQQYNTTEQFEILAHALREELAREHPQRVSA